MIIMATQLTQMLETIEELFNSKYVNDIDFRMNLNSLKLTLGIGKGFIHSFIQELRISEFHQISK